MTFFWVMKFRDHVPPVFYSCTTILAFVTSRKQSLFASCRGTMGNKTSQPAHSEAEDAVERAELQAAIKESLRVSGGGYGGDANGCLGEDRTERARLVAAQKNSLDTSQGLISSNHGSAGAGSGSAADDEEELEQAAFEAAIKESLNAPNGSSAVDDDDALLAEAMRASLASAPALGSKRPRSDGTTSAPAEAASWLFKSSAGWQAFDDACVVHAIEAAWQESIPSVQASLHVA